MAVTDLTNTKWLLNETLGTTTPNGRPYDYGIEHSYNEDYSINFTNGSINYTSFDFHGLGEGGSTQLEYTGTGVYLLVASLSADYAWWEDQAYRTIEITGGTDATNATLIAWLEANATQQVEPSSDVIETTISVGTSLLDDASVGTTKLLKAFIGNHLIFERLGSNFLTSDGKVLMTSDNKIFNVQEAVSTISFTIGNSVFQAESGMNWGDWVQSSYNTEGLTIVTGGYVNWPGSGYVLLGFEQVRYDELIIVNEVYRTSGEND